MAIHKTGLLHGQAGGGKIASPQEDVDILRVPYGGFVHA